MANQDQVHWIKHRIPSSTWTPGNSAKFVNLKNVLCLCICMCMCVWIADTHMSQCVWTISCISSCLPCCLPPQIPRALALNFQGFLGLHLESHHKGAGVTSTQCHVQLYVEWGIGNLNYLPSFVNSYTENELIIHERLKWSCESVVFSGIYPTQVQSSRDDLVHTPKFLRHRKSSVQQSYPQTVSHKKL